MTKEIIRDALKIGFPFIAIIALVMGTALPVLADNPSKSVSALRLVQGEVISVASDNSTFVIQNGSHQQVTITVDSNTRYFVVPAGKAAAAINSGIVKDKEEKKLNKPGPKQYQAAGLKESDNTTNCGNDSNLPNRYGKEAKFSDIQVGDRVIASVKIADNLATQVFIIKAPVNQKVKGTITAISDSSITITPASGTAVTLSWDGNTRFMLKGLISVQTGQYAAAVYNRNTMTALSVDVEVSAPAPALETSPVT
jgi:hypothetical protein